MPELSRLPLAIVTVSLAAGCAAAHERDVPIRPAGPAPCLRWEPAGPVVVVSETTLEATHSVVAIRSADAVMVGWVGATGDGVIPYTFTFDVRALEWSGAPRGPITHPSTPTTGSDANIELASHGRFIGALVSTARQFGECRFLVLDEASLEQRAPAEFAGADCGGLAADDEGFSFFTGPTLYRIDDAGAQRGVRLGVADVGDRLWFAERRVLFDDDSFLVSLPWDALQHFDAQGNPLAPEVEQQELAMTATRTGAVVLLDPHVLASSLAARALDRDGRPTGDMYVLPGAGRNPTSLPRAVASTREGDDVIAAWQHQDDEGVHVRVQALGPDAAPRADPVVALTGVWPDELVIVVERSGERALLIVDAGSVMALPLACAR